MPIFRRDPPARSAPGASTTSSAEASAVAGRRGTVTLIAPGTRIKGELTGATEIQIEGEVEGEVRVEALVVVGAGGAVVGPIQGRVVRVVGRVQGNVRAAERVEVGPAGSLEGDIAAPRVVIAEGAFFKGMIDMKGEKSREPRRPSRSGAEARSSTVAEAGSK